MGSAKLLSWAGAAVVLGAVVVGAYAGDGAADAGWVIEPGAEEDGAVAAGAAEVARAQKLAKKKQFAEAVTILEAVARAHPAATHDCNLSLAYLRAGDATRAQLLWEVAATRGGVRPDWCTDTLPGTLATGLTRARLVPVTLRITPADAAVEVAGITLRGLAVIWLPPGTHDVRARADGYRDGITQVAVSGTSATASLTLEAPLAVEPEPVTVDAAVPEVAADAPVRAPSDAPAGPAIARLSPPATRWPGWASLAIGVVALGTGATFHVVAAGTRADASELFESEPELEVLRDRFGQQRNLAIAGYVIGAAATAFGAAWLLTHRETRGPALEVAVGRDGAAVSLGWALP